MGKWKIIKGGHYELNFTYGPLHPMQILAAHSQYVTNFLPRLEENIRKQPNLYFWSPIKAMENLI